MGACAIQLYLLMFAVVHDVLGSGAPTRALMCFCPSYNLGRRRHTRYRLGH